MSFCSHCGGKVITERITGKKLFTEFLANSFGWDNRFFRTLKAILLDPKRIYSEYLEGARSKYTNPFKFFGIAAAISLIVFNFYSVEYMDMTKQSMEGSYANYGYDKSLQEMTASELETLDKHELAQLKYNDKVRSATLNFTEFSLKYFSLVSFILLPLYALFAFVVFRKPHNFGEHLVINAYIQGMSFILMVMFFFLALITNVPAFFNGVVFLTMILYVYTYTRLNQYNFKQVIVKILWFILGLIVIGFVFGIVGFILAIVNR